MWANSKKHAAHPSLWWGWGCPMAWRSSSLLPQKASAGLLLNLEQQQAALWYGKAADELYQTCYKISIPPNLLIQTSSVRNTSSHSLLSLHCVSALKQRKYNYVITLEIKRADESMCTTSQQSWTKILHKVLSFQKILVGPSLTYFSHWRAWNINSQSLLLAWLMIWWILGHSCQEKQLQKNKYTM